VVVTACEERPGVRGVTSPRALAQIDLDSHETIVEAADHARRAASWSDLRSQDRPVMVQPDLADNGSRRETVRGTMSYSGPATTRGEPGVVARMWVIARAKR
jgi:hypothetical protein